LSHNVRPDGTTYQSAPMSAWIIAGLLCLAAAFRIPAVFTDFWLDEIFTYERIVRPAASVLDLVAAPAARHDNNHHLNSLFLYLLGEQRHWAIYRLPALAAGLLTVILASRTRKTGDRLQGTLSGILVACSFMMIVYSTEARGYAFVLLFALLAFLALDQFLDTGRRAAAVLFWTWVTFGLVSHASIAHFYIGALLWSGYRLRGRFRDMVWLHGGPAVVAIVWQLIVLRGAIVGGGDAWTWRRIADESLAWTIGYPVATIPAAVAVAAVVLIVIWDARDRWQLGGDDGLFFVGVILGPPVLIAALSPPFLFPRYFLVSLFFFLLVLGRALSRLWRQPRWGPTLAGAVTVLIAAGNISHVATFFRYGRGSPSQAISHLVASTPGAEIRVTSPSVDLWSQLPIQFYERTLNLGRRIRLTPRQHLPGGIASASGFDWIVVPSDDLTGSAALRLTTTSGESYSLEKDYPAYGPSGLRWLLYRHD
jgi:4-amino-4-deoxy-L-arabinose transferase-like glycosyltransferase